MKNYYNVLHVSSAADAVQIKKAYRNLCKRYHPDRHGGSTFHEEKLKEINEAYRILTDPGKRDAYNRQLVTSVKPRSKTGASRPASTWGPPEYARTTAGRSFAPPRRSAVTRGSGNFFWSVMLVLVFFIPAWMSGSAETSAPLPGEYSSYDMSEKLSKRFKQEVYYLNEIKSVDPDLERLDLDTGYYQLDGKTIRLSWDILQLIRKNGWKARS